MVMQKTAERGSPLSFKQEVHNELISIGDWWLEHSLDRHNGGFYGEVGVDNQPRQNAPKGVVLNARILWFFSELALYEHDTRYRQAATRAYEFLMSKFFDPEHGGFFWSLTAEGKPLDTKKQVYAQAFAIYALASYYTLTKEQAVLDQALACFDRLERHSLDRRKEGYLEAFSRDWGEMDDFRLSDKDLNFPKTMNTHLHVLEAYTALHAIASTEAVKKALRYTINCFDKRIINYNSYHLRMFMDHEWGDHSPGYTFGHDIECSWLLAKALDSLDDPAVSDALKPVALKLAEVCLAEAVGERGEVLDCYEFATKRRHYERVWWVQAEALVGFIKAYVVSGEDAYLRAAENLWEFIKKYQIDGDGGEWFWLSTMDAQPPVPHYKLGFWKGPYHNGRAMLEAGRLLSII